MNLKLPLKIIILLSILFVFALGIVSKQLYRRPWCIKVWSHLLKQL